MNDEQSKPTPTPAQDAVTKAVLDYSPIEDVEHKLGVSRLGNADIKNLCLDLFLVAHAVVGSKMRNEHMLSLGDSTFCMDMAPWILMVQGEGFVQAGRFEFTREKHPWDTEQIEDIILVHAHKEKGIILVSESYSPEGRCSRNQAKMYFAMDRKTDSYYPPGCSGGLESRSDPHWRKNPKWREGQPTDLFFFGDRGINDGFKFHMRELTKFGDFIPVWPAGACKPFNMFLVNADYKTESGRVEMDVGRKVRDQLNHERFMQCDKVVHDIINGNLD